MMESIYFCLFCRLKYGSNGGRNQLKHHMIECHSDGNAGDSRLRFEKWIDWLITYQTELNNGLLRSDPKVLPMLASNNDTNKLRIGCSFCDKIIETFKLNVKPIRKNLCVCGEGKGTQLIVVNCKNCSQMFHYDCVEPNGYSGQELSLYVCVNCKPKNYEISELKSLFNQFKKLHCHTHLHYEPYVCRLRSIENPQKRCLKRFFSYNFIESHLKTKHNFSTDKTMLSNDVLIVEKIPQVLNLVERSVDSVEKQSSSAVQSIQKQSSTTVQSVQKQSSTTVHSNSNNNSNEIIKRKPNDCDNKIGSKKQKSSNESPKKSFNESPIVKRGRGRPRKSLTPGRVNTDNASSSTVKTKTQLRTNSSEINDIMSNHLHSKPNKISRTIVYKSTSQSNGREIEVETNEKSETSSDWDSDVEVFDSMTFEEAVNRSKGNKSNTHPKSVPTQTAPNRVMNESIQLEQMRSNSNYENVSEISTLDDLRLSSCTSSSSHRNLESIDLSESRRMSCQTTASELSEPSFDSRTTESLTTRMGSNSNLTGVGTSHQNLVNPSNYLLSNVKISEWLTHTVPKKFPYFPQLNDEIIYFQYGHKQYMNAIQTLKLYKTRINNKLQSSQEKQIIAKVIGFKFETKSNIPLCQLNLQKIDSQSNIETKMQFSVKFTDIDNVLDFIVLRQLYNTSIGTHWKIGDEFRAIVEDKWWVGNIAQFNTDREAIDSVFQTFWVKWGNREVELLSFWDIEKVETNTSSQERTNCFEITPEERAAFYDPSENEWPVCGKDEECKRIAKGLEQIMTYDESKEFLSLESNLNPNYQSRIAYPINLQMIKSRVENRFYRRHAAIKYEIKFIESNARILEPEGSDYVRDAQIVTKICLKFIDQLSCHDSNPIYNEVKNESRQSLEKIKFYSTTRPHLNPQRSEAHIDLQERLNQYLFSGPMPGVVTSGQQINIEAIPVPAEDENATVITLDDDSEDENEEGIEVLESDEDINPSYTEVRHTTTQDNQVNSGTAIVCDIPMNENVQNICNHSRTSSTDSILNPSHVSQSTESAIISVRYLCVFCGKTSEDRNEIISHLNEELKCKLVCRLCNDKEFKTFNEYSAHNKSHSRPIDRIGFETKQKWIEKFLNYFERLSNQDLIETNISQYFGDCCPVCQHLNASTDKSIIREEVFRSHRNNNKENATEEAFKQHILEHMSYETLYKCTLCNHYNTDQKFVCKGVDNEAKNHIITVHNVSPNTTEDITSFFNNCNYISYIEELSLDLANQYLIKNALFMY